MKKYLSVLLAALLCVMLAVAVSAADVYVNDGGTGDGSSAAAPMGSMTDAITKIAATGGTVHIVDVYTCAEEYYEPAHDGDIVIDGGRYVFTNGKYNRWFLSGPGSTTFQNITFEYGAGNTSLFLGQFNPIIFGEGLTFPEGKCYVVGGYQAPTEVPDAKTDLDSHITIKSGSIWAVAGFNRGGGEIDFTGTSYINIEGGEIETVYGANINGNFAGNTVINVSGGVINNLRLGGDATRRINGNAEATVSGGMIGLLSVNNIMGTAVVNYKGGMIASAEKTVSENLVPLVVDGTATLNASPNVEARMLALSFDAVNYVTDGEVPPAPATKAPVETTVPVETTAAPAETTVAPAETTAAPAETTVAITETSEAPAETTAASVESTETSAETTVESSETTVDSKEESKTPAETEPAPSEGGENEKSNRILIIGGVAAALVCVIAVVLVVVKKKKN